MNRIYAVAFCLGFIVIAALFLRADAARDARQADEIKRAQKYEQDRRAIDDALSESQRVGDWRQRLCVARPDLCPE